MVTESNKRRLTASEKRFVNEVAELLKMPLEELLVVEKNRIPVGV